MDHLSSRNSNVTGIVVLQRDRGQSIVDSSTAPAEDRRASCPLHHETSGSQECQHFLHSRSLWVCKTSGIQESRRFFSAICKLWNLDCLSHELHVRWSHVFGHGNRCRRRSDAQVPGIGGADSAQRGTPGSTTFNQSRAWVPSTIWTQGLSAISSRPDPARARRSSSRPQHVLAPSAPRERVGPAPR